ncbi:osteopetrosis-associated transmembrane protein 1 isoform X2 [Macrosteles quadrilineatus]|uniref:osteopetrosis-associated transmembrane protein 1 isoform X2 n=1 Tax=Macrosteles quadrilineatus TaxID=74068 RepID=UPI0023E331BD|nr:osteopetrosis-associated transmembrane protein 1 isoform X2 [Macrosteles quadrilineatus]
MSEPWFLLVLFLAHVSYTSATSNSTKFHLKGFSSFGDACEEVLESFALASANYTFCAIRFARPIRLCEFCVGNYQNVIAIHNDILNLYDPDNFTCKDKLMNLDRLQVVQSGFDYVDGLWKRAKCSNCFEMDDQGYPTKSLNYKTLEILELSNKTYSCIDKHRNDTSTRGGDPPVCAECKQFYQDLNSHYDSLKNEGFCMDIVDMMNLTRAMWSSELKCCLERKQPEWLFLVSSCVFTCLPFVFYLAAFMFVTSKEQTLLKQRRLQENFNTGAHYSGFVGD